MVYAWIWVWAKGTGEKWTATLSLVGLKCSYSQQNDSAEPEFPQRALWFWAVPFLALRLLAQVGVCWFSSCPFRCSKPPESNCCSCHAVPQGPAEAVGRAHGLEENSKQTTSLALRPRAHRERRRLENPHTALSTGQLGLQRLRQ